MQNKGEKMNNDYPGKWNDLPKKERKAKIKAWRKRIQKRELVFKKIRNWSLVVGVLVVSVFAYVQLNKKTPEEIAFESEVKESSLEGKVEEFDIEGRDHVDSSVDVNYQTNPPTSGDHLAEAENWGIYQKEIDDKAAVHSMEHGGIWISYKDISDEEIEILEGLGKKNSQSTVVSPRSANDSQIVIASWGKMMELDQVDEPLIQKYINNYKNQSPEKLAR